MDLGGSGIGKGREKCFQDERNGGRAVSALWLVPVQGAVCRWLILVGLLKIRRKEKIQKE